MAKILIIDDDGGIRKMLRKVLEHAGYDVAEACNGEEGMSAYRENPMISLVIMDIVMPEKEGITVLTEFKRDFPKVKTIVISGGGHIKSETYLDIAKKFGADATLAKPVKYKALLKVVEELI
ncbi:response regulator [Desulfococcaceae bacterium HSG8]|nr:response regulator [Desulfococcaceae bacterium HSG8]